MFETGSLLIGWIGTRMRMLHTVCKPKKNQYKILPMTICIKRGSVISGTTIFCHTLFITTRMVPCVLKGFSPLSSVQFFSTKFLHACCKCVITARGANSRE